MTTISSFIHDVKRVLVEKISHANGTSKIQTLRVRVITGGAELTFDMFATESFTAEIMDAIKVNS